ncbi:MAG TPA: DNA repair protein RadC [Thermoanaerobaculia bacterium]|nr:DNA repair protein RadC [Thermoanaerobaculia bacterium]
MTEIIADLPLDDRPRERLLKRGPSTLTNSELVAILIGSGTRGKNAIQLARELLVNGLSALMLCEHAQLAAIRGVGPAKASRILATLEISRRIAAGEPEEQLPYDSDSFARRLVGAFAQHKQERLGAAFLDSRRHIIKDREVFVGTVNRAVVSARDIIRFAVDCPASGVVLYHNHPSGDPTPSNEDFKFTDNVKAALKLIDIELVDHLVIGAHRYYSMQQRGQI